MLPKFKAFWKCNILELSRKAVFCIEGMAFIFITYSFYFIYFYLIILVQKIITSLQKSGCVRGGGWLNGGGTRVKAPTALLSFPVRDQMQKGFQVYFNQQCQHAKDKKALDELKSNVISQISKQEKVWIRFFWWEISQT